MYPRFLCIGAQKAGTSWLFDNLRQHPQIWLPPVKEVHYFDHRRTSLRQRLFGRTALLRSARAHLWRRLQALPRGGSWADAAWAARYCLLPRGDRWYRGLFPDAPGIVAGDISPGYASLRGEQVEQVRRLIPQARIIYLLRNPVDRAWSHAYRHFRKARFGGIGGVGDAEIRRHFALDRERHGNYLATLAEWEGRFGSDRMFVGFFEDLSTHPQALLRRILRFLEVDDSDARIPPTVAEPRNIGTAQRYSGLRIDAGAGAAQVGHELPDRLRRHLAELYVADLRALNERFANPSTALWLRQAEHALAGKADG